ncbi:MAG: hypothetical protein JWM32_3032 [Verrucomicrobia bacterium]|nr:hypothetical protein [Verrucomicrobiota bacterium]
MADAAAAPLAVGLRKQLFMDERFVEQAENVVWRMNSPVKVGAVLTGTNSWENGIVSGAGTVIEDGGKFRLWYTACPASGHPLGLFRLCYAESSDGLTWVKPNLGIYEWEGSKANNILMESSIENGGGVFLDPTAPPAQRYKLLARLSEVKVLVAGHDPQWGNAPHGSGLYMYTSPDGLHWDLQPTRVFPFSPDTVNMALYDDRTKRFLAYLRTWNGDQRRVGVVEIENMLAPWPYDKNVPPRALGKFAVAPSFPVPDKEIPDAFGADAGDPPDVDHYTSATVKYPWAEDVYLMFPSPYRHFPPPPASLYHNDGPLDIALAISRDGRKFHRVSRFPYIELGLTGAADSGSMYMFIGMIRHGAELFQYYGGCDWTHGGFEGVPEMRNRGGVRLTRQRLDGFVSLEADEKGGQFTTPALIFEGTHLALNLNASATGEVWVELRDADGHALPGYAFADSDSLGQNDVAKVVTWRGGKADVSALAGHAVRIAFKLRTAKLYAFQFLQ